MPDVPAITQEPCLAVPRRRQLITATRPHPPSSRTPLSIHARSANVQNAGGVFWIGVAFDQLVLVNLSRRNEMLFISTGATGELFDAADVK
jgi:hypothetical protein